MRAARVRAPGSSPSHLGPPKARIMSISWKPWASLGAPSPADAHDARACGAHHEVTVAGGSSIIEFAGAAPRRPKTCPNATRNACVFRSHSPANFEFSRPCRRQGLGMHWELIKLSTSTKNSQKCADGGNCTHFLRLSHTLLELECPDCQQRKLFFFGGRRH